MDHALMIYTGAVRTERTSFDFGAPSVLSVRREGNRWQVVSSMLARRVIEYWSWDLAKAGDPVPKAKQRRTRH